MSRVLVLHPSAKINLTLRVGPRRSDGFHDVRTLFQSIALSDQLTITERRGPFALSTSAPGVPADDTNLVSRAAGTLWQALGRPGEPRDAHVRLVKHIPVAAGLGGGSADAAAALIGLNLIWQGRFDRADLSRIGATLGSDVPFFLLGGTALGTGKGEELYPVDDLPRLSVVIVKPAFGVSAADAYRWLDEDRAGAIEEARPRRGLDLDVGWPMGPLSLVNDLEGPVVARHPMVGEILTALVRAGARAAAMTGSGSAAFGVFPGPMSRAALRSLDRPDWLVILTRTVNRRETSRRMLV